MLLKEVFTCVATKALWLIVGWQVSDGSDVEKLRMEIVALKLKLTNMKQKLENPLSSAAGNKVGRDPMLCPSANG